MRHMTSDRLLRPVPFWLMRFVVTAHAIGVFAQPVLAGQFLAGSFDFLEIHGRVGEITEVAGLVQVVVAVLLRWPGGGPSWPILASVLVLLAEIPQVFVGYTGFLALHVPLGVLLFGAMLLLLIWVWRAGSRPHRPAESPATEAGRQAEPAR